MNTTLAELIKMERKRNVIQPKLKYNTRASRNYQEEASFSRRLYLYRLRENGDHLYMISALRMDAGDFGRSMTKVTQIRSYQLGAEVSLSALGTINALIRKDGDYFVRAGFAYNVYKDGHLHFYENRLEYVSNFFSEKLMVDNGERSRMEAELNQKQFAINVSFEKILANATSGMATPIVWELMGLLLPYIKQV